MRIREQLHIFERICGMTNHVIGHDRDSADAKPGKLRYIAYNAIDHRFDERAVIAQKHHQRPVRAGDIGEAMISAITAWQFEIDRLPAEIAYRCDHCSHGMSYEFSVQADRIHHSTSMRILGIIGEVWHFAPSPLRKLGS